MARKMKKTIKTIETLTHDEASRKNIPTAEYQSVMREDEKDPIRVAYERRNRELGRIKKQGGCISYGGFQSILCRW